MSATATQAHTIAAPSPKNWLHRYRRHCIVAAIAVFLAVAIGYVSYLAQNWPFTETAVNKVLHDVTLRTVKIGKFRQTFFPLGCVAEDVQFERHLHPGQNPVISIQQLTIQASYWRLLTGQYRLSLVRAAHLHVMVPPARVHGKPDPLMPLNHTSSVTSIRIDKIIMDGAVVDFYHEDGSTPYRIIMDKLFVHDVSNNSVIPYKTIFESSIPPGKLESTGVFGPWHPNNPELTPVKGNITYQDGNLAALKFISGTLGAQVSFNGKLGEVVAKGTSKITDFKVEDTSHSRNMDVQFQMRVNGVKGDINLDDVRAQFDRSTVNVKGNIQGVQSGPNLTMSLDLLSGRGRVEDILDLFISAKRSPMVGAVSMTGHIDLPAGKEEFLRRIKMTGDFGVDNGKFTDKATQQDLNRLSASGDKKEPNDPNEQLALSDLKGHANIRNGVATLTDVTFAIPNATSAMEGTYNIINYDVDLHGDLFTDGKPWTATTGMKSFFLRVVTPFMKKKQNVRIVPIKITGNYNNMSVGLDLGRK